MRKNRVTPLDYKIINSDLFVECTTLFDNYKRLGAEALHHNSKCNYFNNLPSERRSPESWYVWRRRRREATLGDLASSLPSSMTKDTDTSLCSFQGSRIIAT